MCIYMYKLTYLLTKAFYEFDKLGEAAAAADTGACNNGTRPVRLAMRAHIYKHYEHINIYIRKVIKYIYALTYTNIILTYEIFQTKTATTNAKQQRTNIEHYSNANALEMCMRRAMN